MSSKGLWKKFKNIFTTTHICCFAYRSGAHLVSYGFFSQVIVVVFDIVQCRKFSPNTISSWSYFKRPRNMFFLLQLQTECKFVRDRENYLEIGDPHLKQNPLPNILVAIEFSNFERFVYA